MRDTETEILSPKTDRLIIPNHPDTLLLCIGNSGRSDDGLGWAFLEEVAKWPDFRGTCEYRYQLGIEDAELISRYRTIIVIDAHTGKLDGGYAWKVCLPSGDFNFSTHEVPPETILYLCRELYAQEPLAYCLMIEGAKWGLHTGLSAVAEINLYRALDNFRKLIDLK